ncbi:MAG: hypothetical protein WC175_04200 [Candidatus Dojkabacteria bacterium]
MSNNDYFEAIYKNNINIFISHIFKDKEVMSVGYDADLYSEILFDILCVMADRMVSDWIEYDEAKDLISSKLKNRIDAEMLEDMHNDLYEK